MMMILVKRLAYSKTAWTAMWILLADALLRWHITFLWIVPLLVFTTIPGRLLFRAVVPGPVSRLNAELYSVGLGLFCLLTNGLLLNEIGRAVGAKAPLTTGNILLLIHIELLLALVTGWMMPHKKSTAEQTVSGLRAGMVLRGIRVADVPIIGAVLLLLLVTIGGVNLLNNGGGNWLGMTALAIAAGIPIVVVLLRRRVSGWSYVGTLFGLSVSLLLFTALRSHYLVGSDVLNEFGIAQLVSHQGYWSITQINNTYNACLSITVLPQVLRAVSGQDGLVIFRDVVQVLFSIAPVVLFAIARNYLKPILAYLAAISFLVFINYNGSLPNHIRQEIGLLFFMLIIMVALSREIPRAAQKIFVVLFSLAMVVSHYSTAYVAIIIFLVSATLNALVWLRHKRSMRSQKRTEVPRMASVINLRMTFAIIMFTFFWYSQIVQSSGGPAAYLTSLGKQFFGGEYSNQHADQTSLKDQFNLFHKSSGSKVHNTFADYLKENQVQTATYHPKPIAAQLTQPRLKPAVANKLVDFVAQLAKKLYKFLAIGGMVFVLWQAWRRKARFNFVFIELLAGAFGVIIISFAIPSFTVEYDQERMFQQLLVILAVPLVYLANLLLAKFRASIAYGAMALFLSFYLLMSTSFLGQLTGGTPSPLQLNNSGTDYARYYVHRSEIASVQWMQSVHRYQPIYADGYAANRLNFATSGKLKVQNSLFPGKFLPGAFIYYDYGNLRNTTTYASFANGPLLYTAPTEYLQTYTNLIYSNGGSVIYAQPY
jgi:uncharacterized membrane protein